MSFKKDRDFWIWLTVMGIIVLAIAAIIIFHGDIYIK